MQDGDSGSSRPKDYQFGQIAHLQLLGVPELGITDAG
jgi:hypothetical protein